MVGALIRLSGDRLDFQRQTNYLFCITNLAPDHHDPFYQSTYLNNLHAAFACLKLIKYLIFVGCGQSLEIYQTSFTPQDVLSLRSSPSQQD